MRVCVCACVCAHASELASDDSGASGVARERRERTTHLGTRKL